MVTDLKQLHKGKTSVSTMPAAASAAAESADTTTTVAHAVDAASVVSHAQHLEHNLFATTLSNTVGMVGIAVSGVLSFILNNRAFKERKEELADKYRPYLACRYGKEPEEVNGVDLESFARENPTVEQSLNRGRTIRNVHTTALIAGSCIAALVLTGMLLGPTFLAGWATAAAGKAFFTVATLKVVGASLAVSYGTTKISSKILTALGLKSLKADSPTAQNYIDHIESLQEKKEPVPEEVVFGAYVASDPFVMEQIRKSFGKSYHKLSAIDKQTVIKTMEEDALFAEMNLPQLTEALSSGQMEAKELAFLPHKQEDLIERTRNYIQQMQWKKQVGQVVAKAQDMGQQALHAGGQAVNAGREAVQGAVQGAVDTTRQWANTIRPQPQIPPQMQPRSIAPDAVKGPRTGAQIGA